MDEVIYKYLTKNTEITDLLAKYADTPAIFNREAPAAIDEDWNDGQTQYPRIIFGLDMQDDPEREISGTLTLDVYITPDVFLENIEPIVHKALDQKFFADAENTIAVNWRTNTPFTTPESGDQIAGVTMVFDVVALPVQHLNYPCPVTAVDSFVKKLFPDYIVIGQDNLPEVFEATDEKPVLYVRLRNLSDSSRPNTYFTQWYDATLMVHIIAPDLTTRSTIAKMLLEAIAIRRQRITMPDDSPMMVNRTDTQMGADQLKTGQITITGTYGILTQFGGTPLKNIIVR